MASRIGEDDREPLSVPYGGDPVVPDEKHHSPSTVSVELDAQDLACVSQPI